MEQIIPVLEALAAKLNVTVEHLWAVIMRQAFLSFWFDLLWDISLLSLIGVWCFIGQKQLFAKMNDSGDDFCELAGPLLFLGWVCVAILASVFILTVGDTITKLVNPEYFALETILKALKKQ